MWDAIVVGAGPAGAVASFVLAREGYRTLLADRLGDEGCKFGEALPGSAVRLLRSLGLPVPEADGPHTSIGGTLSSWNSDTLLASDAIRDPHGPGWRLDRKRFDADLRHAATEAGAIYRADDVSDLQRRDDHWEVRFRGGGTGCTRWIVDATGRRAAVARRLRVRRIRDSRLIAFYATGRSDPNFRLDRTIIEAVPGGWWYAARLPSGAPVAGFHTDARTAARLRADPGAWFEKLAETRHVARIVSPAQFEAPARAFDARGARLSSVAGQGWIACGDAAICFDPVSGQGIFSALHSGYASGMAVIDALDRCTGKLDAYSSQMNEVWDIYRRRLRAIYRDVGRWPVDGFWSFQS
jgi:flavin-dependent dehydrogenase